MKITISKIFWIIIILSILSFTYLVLEQNSNLRGLPGSWTDEELKCNETTICDLYNWMADASVFALILMNWGGYFVIIIVLLILGLFMEIAFLKDKLKALKEEDLK